MQVKTSEFKSFLQKAPKRVREHCWILLRMWYLWKLSVGIEKELLQVQQIFSGPSLDSWNFKDAVGKLNPKEFGEKNDFWKAL
mmetsp:Transcript_16074/g.19132  ORF Transcript_16074/g.19132 Transcript_16074/m.19132 type:complete len:83 (-) Transcript_16074:123-371(-)